MSRRNNDQNSYYSDDPSYDPSSYDDNQTYGDDTYNTSDRNDHDYDTHYTDDPSTIPPDSLRSGRPDSYATRASDRMPAANDRYEDEYDSAESDEEFDDEYYNQRSPYETYEYRNDEAEETRVLHKKAKRDERDANVGKKIVAAVCCCCICLITILVLILVLIVFKEDERVSSTGGPDFGAPTTPKPTPRPTYPLPPALRPANAGNGGEPWLRFTEAPTISPYPTAIASSNPTIAPTKAPTGTPTISPAPTKKVPKEITIDAVDDTYIYVDGFFQYEAFGQEDSFLVQNGLAEYYEFADALGLIAFDLSELPTELQMADYSAQAILKLNHNPVAPQFNSRDAATIQIRKLVSTPMRIETIHGGMLNKEPEASILGENSFTVGVNQASVQVDISDLLYPANFTDTGYDKNQLFLMLINNGEEQGDPKWTEIQFQDQAGDRFKSVESGQGPQLTVTYNAN